MIETSAADLRAVLAVERWVTDVQSKSPFDTLEDLLATAGASATPLAPIEIDEALAHHPRIGEKPVGAGAAQDFSRTEQASVDADDAETNALIAEGNAEYEALFGRVFLIRAAGRTRLEILQELRRRLALPADEELQIVSEQLRDIALLRLATTYGETA